MSEMSRRNGDISGLSSDDAIRATFDWSSTAPSTGVVETLAIALDCAPTAMEPLYESVDPHALDTIVRSNGSGADGTPTTLTFVHAGRDIAVHGDGTVVVRPVDACSEVA